MQIPIQNIYYLLCYSWDRLEEKDIVSVDATMFNNVMDLLSKVLINGINHLEKNGLDRLYSETAESIRGIKGKLELSASIKGNLLGRGHTHCLIDELSFDVLQNRILKSTVYSLIQTTDLDKNLKGQLKSIYQKFRMVSLIRINHRDFGRVTVHRNNSFYDFILKICLIIHEQILVTESTGDYVFKSFLRDEKKMHIVFENFVRNFYRKEQRTYDVKSEIIYWQAIPLEDGTLEKLPQMQTDISLSSDSRKIVIDTKYYVQALNSRYYTSKLHSQHLYQIFAYIQNLSAKGGVNTNCDGMLLYPVVGYELNEAYQIGEHRLFVRTVNLNQHWTDIRDRLISIIK